MDPTTQAHLHTSQVQSGGVDSTGTPILTTTSVPYAGAGSQTSPGAPLSSSSAAAAFGSAHGSANLAAPKSSAPSSDPIAGLSGPQSSNPTSTSTTSSTTTDKVNASAQNAKESAISAKDKAAEQASAAATGIRQRLNSLGSTVEGAADHPAVQNAKVEAEKQVQGLRQKLGQFPLIVQAEKKTGVDRVLLVVGGIFAYIILIPLNLLGLALPTTQLLTFLPPAALAVRTLDRPSEERTKTLLSYFVVFGFVQFAESLMAGFLERRIPQYYTVKLIFLAYLIHPQTKGARKIHASVLRPLLAKSQGQSTHPIGSTTSSSSAHSSYPTTNSAQTGTHTPPSHTARSSDVSVGDKFGSTSPVPTVGSASGVNAPLSRAGGFSGTGPSAPAGFNL